MRAYQIINQKYKDALANFDLSPSLICTLVCLWEFGSLTPGQLSQVTFIDKPVMTSVLDKLEQNGYIRRVPDNYDRRSIRIFLTEEGEIIKTDVLGQIEEIEKEIKNEIIEHDPSLGDKDIDKFYDLLHIVANIPDV